ncbi:MAG: polyprenyl synthetase family protein [Chlamydiae bacterium]|nr:polyprenyl synthetase family protein [Chlamydiota bacterium]MBI3276843.1 polyprenyl synthetase family protein [Chlamydiota bacterium]
MSHTFDQKRKKIDEALAHYLKDGGQEPPTLYESMRYSVLAGGKRLRPVLCLASCEALGKDEDSVIPFACALELIHTYSLIHDDLPCMDDDDFRRGRPTNHKVFGEALAILSGDCLLTLAFEWMAQAKNIPPKFKINAIQEIASAAGADGLVGGQVVDLAFEGKSVTPEKLRYIHIHKTARLIEISVKAGALLTGASKEILKKLSQYGQSLGLAFQITDDLLDVLGDAKKMGKAVRKDAELKKATYPSLFGIEASKKMVEENIQKAYQSIEFLGPKANTLKEILQMVREREN